MLFLCVFTVSVSFVAGYVIAAGGIPPTLRFKREGAGVRVTAGAFDVVLQGPSLKAAIEIFRMADATRETP